MNEYNMNNAQSYEVDGFSSYLTKVYTKMGLGLLVTAAVAAIGYFTDFYVSFISATGAFGAWIPFIVELVLAMSMSTGITRFKPTTVNLLFFAYAAVTGFTFSVLLYAYDLGTVFGAFAFSAILFISCAIIGHVTNVDLSRFSTLLIGALFALVIASVVSMFVPALADSLVLSYIGIILFLFLTAWDVQRLKGLYYTTSSMGEIGENIAVYGAFELYLDFINLFLYVIRILGSRSSSRD